MRFALNSIAIVAGEWLLAHSEPEWVDRYGHRIEETRLPRSQEEREAVAELIGRDGSNLLTDLYEASAPPFLREIPAVEILRRIWLQNYVWVEGQLYWRSNDDLPPGKQFINSPYDQEARLRHKAPDALDGLESPHPRDVRGRRPSSHHACGSHGCSDHR